jgi:hypothetical protein
MLAGDGGRGPTVYLMPSGTGSRPLWHRSATGRRFTLATFLARFWSSPARLVDTFHVDRRALAEHGELDLTEKQIRSALRVLEELGFLDRAVASGSRYKATEDGLIRKPIRFQFGGEYAPLFISANRGAAARRERLSGSDRSQKVLVTNHQASAGLPVAQNAKGPKSKSEANRTVYLGPLVKKSGLPAMAFDPGPRLEAALARLEEGFRQSRGGSGADSAK